jgi:4-amino-4-deoxy-L-arabinose transferase-like glycosyltransferase
MKNQNIKIILILCLILIVAFALRSYNLNTKPIWYDEADSIACAQKPFSSFFSQPHTFSYKCLYFLILKAWIGIFGPWEYPLRFLSVIFGLFSIYLVFKLGLILYNYRVALLSAFLLSISTFHIAHSQQIRYHTLMVMLTILSFYFYVNIFLHLHKRRFYILLNFFVNFLILNTHPYGILIIAAQFPVICFACFRAGSKKIFITWTILHFFGIFLYVFLFFLPSKYYLVEKIWWVPRNSIALLLELFYTLMSGGARYGFDDYTISKQLLFYPTAISHIFLLLFCFSPNAVKIRREKTGAHSKPLHQVILLCWFFVPIVAAYAASYFRPVFLIKHLIFILPAFLILGAKWIDGIGSLWLKISLIILYAAASFFSLKILYIHNDHINWQKPAEHVRKNLSPGDVIVLCTQKETVPFIYYFDYGNRGILTKLDIYGTRSKEGWQEIFKYNNAVIVGLKQQRPEEPLNPFDDFNDKYSKNKFSWRDKNIWLLKSRWCCQPKEQDPFYKIEKKLANSHIKFTEKNYDSVVLSYWKITPNRFGLLLNED